jgi:hypothetical protein
LKVVYLIEVEGLRLIFALCGATGGAAFSLREFIVIRVFIKRKRGAEDVLAING